MKIFLGILVAALLGVVTNLVSNFLAPKAEKYKKLVCAIFVALIGFAVVLASPSTTKEARTAAIGEAGQKYSPEAFHRKQKVLDECAAKINGPVLTAFRNGRKVWDEWNSSQISPQIFAERAAAFKTETLAAFEQIDELWRIYHFDYPEITDLPEWTYEGVIGKTNLLLQELTRFARFSEADARTAQLDAKLEAVNLGPRLRLFGPFKNETV
jgi:hypothetical protein